MRPQVVMHDWGNRAYGGHGDPSPGVEDAEPDEKPRLYEGYSNLSEWKAPISPNFQNSVGAPISPNFKTEEAAISPNFQNIRHFDHFITF